MYNADGKKYTQRDLAKKLILNEDELGNRLRGYRDEKTSRVWHLTEKNVLDIVLALAEWGALTWEQAVELLTFMDYPLNSSHWRTKLREHLSSPNPPLSSSLDHQMHSEHAIVVSRFSPPVVEVDGENGSIALAEEFVPSSTKSQQLRPFQPSTYIGKNQEYAERRGWEYVTYETQHSLGNALMNRQLGPSDVEACPQLPEVATVLQHLAVTSSAIIKGKSGSGKTITAYQAAYAMYKQGWKVLRLGEPHHTADELVDGISHLPQRAILILDNAQLLDSGFVRHLLEHSTDNLAVIIVSTDDVVHPLDAISIVSSRAVTVLAQEVRSHKKERKKERNSSYHSNA